MISAVVIVIVFLITLSYVPIGIEPLTEVYFENHSKLPSLIQINNTYNYAFTINNLEYQKMRYVYNISVFSQNNSLIKHLDTGELILEFNESKTLMKNLTFTEEIHRAKIIINVAKDLSLETPDFKNKLWWPNPNYPMNINIHFWVEQE